MQIALFITCIGDTLFPEAGRATVEVLERLGHEVVFPNEQTCCGQMHMNSGYAEDARQSAKRMMDTKATPMVDTPWFPCFQAVSSR